MNAETYDALKRVIKYVDVNFNGEKIYKDIEQLKNWIDEVAGYYEPGGECYEENNN